MGINPSDAGPITETTRKIAHKVDKRRKMDAKQMTDIIWPAIAAIAVKYRKTHLTNDNVFNREPIPTYAPSLATTTNRRIGILPPRPAITAGYTSHAFSSHQRELQHGLISDIDGAPRDLSKLSHVCKDTYWPFFLIEIHDTSLSAASDLAVDGTATCNNALMTLASALLDPLSSNSTNATTNNPSERLTDCVTQCAASFALAIHKRHARLITHFCEGFVSETAGVVQTYDLSSERDVTSLLVRVDSIFAWAGGSRLAAVGELLEILDRRVGFGECVRDQETVARGPMDVPGVGRAEGIVDGGAGARASPRRDGLFKTVIGSSMPKWSRAEI